MRLTDKVCIITGAGSGQGQAAAALFAQEGSSVVAADIDEDGLKRTEALVQEAGGDIVTVRCDVSKAVDVQAMVRRAKDAYGGIHVLYNNAGVLHPKDGYVTDLDEEIWDLVLGVNLKGMYLTCKYAIPVIRESGGGSIINTSSIGGLMAGSSSAYGASKGGVISLTRNIARQYAPTVRANSICPGPVDTPMMMVARSKTGPTKQSQGKGPLLERWADPSEVAELALYLASDASAFITAANFVIDGGLTAI